MKAIIIAGGLGTRLRPITYNRPKPVVNVVNKPFVVHQIELLKKHGIREIVLNLHYMSENMSYLLGDGEDLGVKLYYSIEEHPLGTAGAVKNAEKYFDGEPMVVFNGDVLTGFNIREIIESHTASKALATITLTKVEDPTPYGLVLMDDDSAKKGYVKQFLEKPSWESVTTNNINAGLYVIEPSVFRDVPEGKPYSFERELFPKLLKHRNKMFAVVSDAYWLDIGSPKKFMQAHKDILNKEVEAVIPGTCRDGVYFGENVNVHPSAKLRGPSVIGNNVNILEGSRVNQYSVLGENVRVSESAMVEDSVIMRNSIIGKDVKLKNCIVGENCIIEDYVEMLYGIVLADYSIVKKGSRLL